MSIDNVDSAWGCSRSTLWQAIRNKADFSSYFSWLSAIVGFLFLVFVKSFYYPYRGNF
jgi:hypothetical protein